MAAPFLRSLCAIMALYAVQCIGLAQATHNYDSRCPTGFANFGDSLTDTANALDAFPFVADAENPPYGETFFGKPAKRFCNGRLVPDFFSMAFNYPLLDGYFAVIFNYKHGINLAVAGAAASLVNTTITPFSLTFQLGQFIRFQNSVNFTKAQYSCSNFYSDLPDQSDYPNWLYTVELGGNDILSQLLANVSIQEIVTTVIPAAVNNITAAIQTLYGRSARKFLIFGIPAQGCSTIALTLFGALGPPDSLGCVDFLNSLVRGFNSALLSAIQQLRTVLTGASIAYFDYYGANVEILQHPQLYGLNPTLTKKACCGAPGFGTLNYNPAVTCGRPGSNVCSNPFEYVNWDGVHFTENFYRVIALFALSAKFTDQGINYTAICNPNFNNFGDNVSYGTVYGYTCSNQFA